ncbi:MAG: hypothetical protein AAF483_22020 [Planctomycetota bacterium]
MHLTLFLTLLTSVLVCASSLGSESAPVPDAAYGRIELQEPLPDHVKIHANWLHDKANGFRILVPPMSKVHCPKKPIAKGASQILLRIEPFDMLDLEIGLIPKSIKGKQLTAERILDSIAADEKTDIIRKDSTMGTSWIGRGYRTLGKNAPPQSMTMLASKSNESFVFARIRSRFPLELRTALAILDSFKFVEADLRLEKVLTMRESDEPQTEFVPKRKMRAWFENDRPNGLVTHEDYQGRRVYSLTWLNGQQSGLEIMHWPTGEVYRLGLFEYGKAQAQRLTFYKTGELHSTIEVQNGVREGNYCVYYRNGNLSDVVKLKNGLRHGVSLHYLPDGRLLGRTHYDRGQEVGEEVLLQIGQAEHDAAAESIPDPHVVWNVSR